MDKQLNIFESAAARDAGMQQAEEIWVNAPDLEGYMVSNQGQMKALYKEVKTPNGGVRTLPESILKPKINSQGYCQFKLGSRNCKVHRLIAIAFIPNPENKPTVNHKNGIRHDNRIENLEWATYSEQEFHSYSVLGRVPTYLNKSGKDHNKSKPVYCITNSTLYWSIREAGKILNIHNGTICSHLKGKMKNAEGFVFRYANGEDLKEEGMSISAAHAEAVHDGWGNKAFTLLQDYVRQAHGHFMCEDIRAYSEANGLPVPPSNRSWGSVMVRASKAGIIKSTGLGPVANPKAHRANANIYLPNKQAA